MENCNKILVKKSLTINGRGTLGNFCRGDNKSTKTDKKVILFPFPNCPKIIFCHEIFEWWLTIIEILTKRFCVATGHTGTIRVKILPVTKIAHCTFTCEFFY